jgi:hypothetical protein
MDTMTHPESYGLPAPPPPEQTPSTYAYVGGNPELDQLLAMEVDLYAQAKDLERRQEEVKDRIKIALTSVTRPVTTPVYDGQADVPTTVNRPYERYRIALPGQVARVLRWKVSRRINTPALKKALPDVYAAYSEASGAWYLEREK